MEKERLDRVKKNRLFLSRKYDVANQLAKLSELIDNDGQLVESEKNDVPALI